MMRTVFFPRGPAVEPKRVVRADPPAEKSRRLVRCLSCGLVADCTPERVLRYAKSGWPQCCGQTMTYFTETTRPGGDDTTPNVRPLS